MYTSPELVHLAILKDAEEIANRRLQKEFGIDSQSTWQSGRFNPEKRKTFTSGQVFRADPLQSTKGGLCLSIEEATVRASTDEQIAQLHQIGLEAIRESIVRNHDAFIGLVLGEARQGRNYFDRFNSDEIKQI